MPNTWLHLQTIWYTSIFCPLPWHASSRVGSSLHGTRCKDRIADFALNQDGQDKSKVKIFPHLIKIRMPSKIEKLSDVEDRILACMSVISRKQRHSTSSSYASARHLARENLFKVIQVKILFNLCTVFYGCLVLKKKADILCYLRGFQICLQVHMYNVTEFN